MGEHALGLVSLLPREPAAGDRGSHGVCGHEDCPDEAEADPDHPPADVVCRCRDLGSLAQRDQGRRIALRLKDLGHCSIVDRPHPEVGRLQELWTRGDATSSVLAYEPATE
jgi:hypothetical protein